MPGNQLSLSLLDMARVDSPHKSDAERIADIAAGLIEDLAQEPPIPLEIVASYRDISDIQVVPMPQAGSLAPGAETLQMRLRASDSPVRRRFTGFHEITHTFQPGYREMQLFRCATSTRPRSGGSDPEALSDIGAAEMLLPRAYFAPATAASSFELGSVLELAHTYEASIEATGYRFARFWPEPVVVVILEPGLRKDERDDPEAVAKLRVVSAWADPQGAWPFIPINKSAVEDGALMRALDGELINERAGLEELGLKSDGNVELTARMFPYRRGAEQRARVLAMYRQVGRTRG